LDVSQVSPTVASLDVRELKGLGPLSDAGKDIKRSHCAFAQVENGSFPLARNLSFG